MDLTIGPLADELLDVIAQEDPLNDALEGYPRYADQLADLDEDAQWRLRDRAAAIAVRARTEPIVDGYVDRAVVAQQADAVVARIEARLVEHTMSGYDHSPLGRILGALPQGRPANAVQESAFLRRLESIPEFLAKAAARHRAGVAAGRTPVAERARHAVGRIDAYLSWPPDDPLHQVELSSAAARERDRLLTTEVRPALAAYREVLDADVAPHGRPPERVGLCHITGGERTYHALVRMHTTTSRDPVDLHRLGLELIDRLAEEYAAVGEQAFGLTDAGEVRHRLRTDPGLRWRDGDEVLAAAREAVGRAEQAAARWFGRRPSTACAVQPAPDPDGPSGYYLPPALDGSRPGTYFANVTSPTERARYVAEALAFHEAIPGHHFQLCIAQQLTDLLQLRRLAWINAYIEGWGLYAERLADEMGLYSGPLARLGMLAMDSLRAARLVVDTGMHAFGWGRRRAVDYLLANTVLTDVEAQVEIDRYIEFPAQALSYMVGRLEFQRLRERAEGALGPAFDVRDFHDIVLANGPLPMPVLDTVVTDWAAARAPDAAP